jgi:hypothetical protein
MRSKPEYPLESFESIPRLGEPWLLGKKLLAMPPAPLEYHFSRNAPDTLYPMYELPYPLIRLDLLDRLRAAGVDNIQTVSAVLYHPRTGVVRDKYAAFNVVGMIATSPLAAELMCSYTELEFETDEVDGIESNWSLIPYDTRFARIADRLGRIVVSDELRQRIAFEPDSGLVFFDLIPGPEQAL